MTRWKKALLWLLALGLAALVVAQLVPVARTNPPVESEVVAPAQVRAILERSCFDCHSHETRWPWYSRVAPASWLVAHDVDEARRELNFSRWEALEPDERAEVPEEIVEEVQSGHMPPWFYLVLHWDAKVSAEDLSVLRSWAAATAHAED